MGLVDDLGILQGCIRIVLGLCRDHLALYRGLVSC